MMNEHDKDSLLALADRIEQAEETPIGVSLRAATLIRALLSASKPAAQDAAKLTAEIKELVREKPTAVNAYGLKSWAKIEQKIAEALAASPAAPAQSGKAVMWVILDRDGDLVAQSMTEIKGIDWQPLYAAPQPSQPVEAGDTDEMVSALRIERTITRKPSPKAQALYDKLAHVHTRPEDGEIAKEYFALGFIGGERSITDAPSAVVLDDERAAFDGWCNSIPANRSMGPWEIWQAARAAYPQATATQPAQPSSSRACVLEKAAVLCDQLAEEFPGGAADLCAKTLRRFNEQLDKRETRQ